ncbi:MAG: hypothetical protein FWD47_09045, partial [Treponema sp.]|nr:hypothetical protein [Treponema sp.]
PDPAAHEAMKNMKSFTFKVLGDGNIYDIQLMTTESRVEGGFNHYRKTQTTKKNEIITVTVNIDELTQVTTYGKKVPFIQNNIECFQIQPFSTGEFSLKIWDIRFNQ